MMFCYNCNTRNTFKISIPVLLFFNHSFSFSVFPSIPCLACFTGLNHLKCYRGGLTRPLACDCEACFQKLCIITPLCRIIAWIYVL